VLSLGHKKKIVKFNLHRGF